MQYAHHHIDKFDHVFTFRNSAYEGRCQAVKGRKLVPIIHDNMTSRMLQDYHQSPENRTRAFGKDLIFWMNRATPPTGSRSLGSTSYTSLKWNISISSHFGSISQALSEVTTAQGAIGAADLPAHVPSGLPMVLWEPAQRPVLR